MSDGKFSGWDRRDFFQVAAAASLLLPLLALLRPRSLLKPKLMLRRNRHLNPALTPTPRT